MPSWSRARHSLLGHGSDFSAADTPTAPLPELGGQAAGAQHPGAASPLQSGGRKLHRTCFPATCRQSRTKKRGGAGGEPARPPPRRKALGADPFGEAAFLPSFVHSANAGLEPNLGRPPEAPGQWGQRGESRPCSPGVPGAGRGKAGRPSAPPRREAGLGHKWGFSLGPGQPSQGLPRTVAPAATFPGRRGAAPPRRLGGLATAPGPHPCWACDCAEHADNCNTWRMLVCLRVEQTQ